jgi:hypothetical protein
MRSLLAAAAICLSTISASAEEPYIATSKVLATCIGLQMREVLTPGNRIMSPNVMLQRPKPARAAYIAPFAKI